MLSLFLLNFGRALEETLLLQVAEGHPVVVENGTPDRVAFDPQPVLKYTQRYPRLFEQGLGDGVGDFLMVV